MTPAPFEVDLPRAPETPVVVEVPHAGLTIPDAWRVPLDLDERSVIRDADTFVDELVQNAPMVGAAVLRANLSRYVVDLNRGRDEYDARAVEGARADVSLPHGLFWHTTAAGARLLRRALREDEAESRLRALYDPYHAELERLVHERIDTHGIAVILAVHSMPAYGSTRAGHGRRADVVPGTQSFTTAAPALVSLVESWAREAGLTLAHDDPYRGGWVTKHWGRPRRGFHAIQLEFARELYMDESTLERKPDRLAALGGACVELVRRLGVAAAALAPSGSPAMRRPPPTGHLP